jgi:patatin-related protein
MGWTAMTPVASPAAQPALAVSDATQAIRLATTMTGGVSLAIWMGGVAREIDLLSQASQWRRKNEDETTLPVLAATANPSERVRGLYLGLLNLLDVLVDTDILSGTSAGGINASLLAYSRVKQKDLGALREIWLEVGSLLTLLRDPADKDVPSLLLGDEQMYGQLKAKLPVLADVQPATFKRDKAASSTTLFVTTTLLSGETSRFTDDFGTLVQDVDHHGLFRFTETKLQADDAPSALALAARSSASFPAAFEPSFIPFDANRTRTAGTPQMLKVPPRPNMAPFTDFTRSHWAADGGLLNNRPIGPLLQAVFDRPAIREVRRVLLYIVPSAGDSPDPVAAEPGDDVTKPYGLAEGLFKELGAVLKQSITSDLRAIRDHNDKVRVRTDVRLQIADFATPLPAGGSLLSDRLIADFRAREAEIIAGPIVEAIMRLLSTWPPAAGKKPADPSIPQLWQGVLKPGGNAEPECRKSIVKALTKIWKCEPATLADLATYGRPAFEGAKAVAIAIVRTALQAAPSLELRKALIELSRSLHGAFLAAERRDLSEFVEEELKKYSKPSATQGDVADLDVVAAQIATDYFVLLNMPKKPSEDQKEPKPPTLAEAWKAIGESFIQHRDLLDRIAGTTPFRTRTEGESSCDHVQTPQEKLATYLAYLAWDSAEALAKRLFDLYAAQRAMLPLSADVEQPVELIQLSADTRTLLNLERSTAASKLTGEQMHHFGAFFKQSWRANDWMWGRLDGAGWLVHLLLDPRRIEVIARAQPITGSRADWFIARLIELGADDLPATDPNAAVPADPEPLITRKKIDTELAFLDDDDEELPASLPLTAMWVAKTPQLHIAVDELPVLARTVVSPQNDGPKVRDAKKEHISAVSRQWAERVLKPSGDARKARDAAELARDARQRLVLDPQNAEAKKQAAAALEKVRQADAAAAESARNLAEQAANLLSTCPIPGETLQGEMGTPLMVRTLAKTAADATAALDSVKQIPGVIRPVFSWARTVTLAGYRITKGTGLGPKIMIVLGVLLLAGGTLAAVQQAALWGIGGAIVASVGGYLLVFGAWQTSRLVLGSVLSTTLVFGAAALSLPSTRRGLFGTSEADPGWLGRKVHWLALSGWHPVIALGILLFAFAVLGLIFESVGRRKHHVNAHRWDRINHSPPAIVGYVVAVAVIVGAGIGWACVYHHDHPKKGPQDSALGIAVLKSVTDSAAALPSALEGLELQLAKTNPSTTDTLKGFTNAFLTEFGQNLAGKSEGSTGTQVQAIIQAFAKAPLEKPADTVTAAVCTALNAGLTSPATATLTTANPKVAAALSTARAELDKPATAPACQQIATWLVSLDPKTTPGQASAAITLAGSAALTDAKQ